MFFGCQIQILRFYYVLLCLNYVLLCLLLRFPMFSRHGFPRFIQIPTLCFAENNVFVRAGDSKKTWDSLRPALSEKLCFYYVYYYVFTTFSLRFLLPLNYRSLPLPPLPGCGGEGGPPLQNRL